MWTHNRVHAEIRLLWHDQFKFSMTKKCWKPSLLGTYHFCSITRRMFPVFKQHEIFGLKIKFNEFPMTNFKNFPWLRNAANQAFWGRHSDFCLVTRRMFPVFKQHESFGQKNNIQWLFHDQRKFPWLRNAENLAFCGRHINFCAMTRRMFPVFKEHENFGLKKEIHWLFRDLGHFS